MITLEGPGDPVILYPPAPGLVTVTPAQAIGHTAIVDGETPPPAEDLAPSWRGESAVTTKMPSPPVGVIKPAPIAGPARRDADQAPAELNADDRKAMEDFQHWYDQNADTPTDTGSSLFRAAQDIAQKHRLALPSIIGDNGRQVPFAERPREWQVFAVIAHHLTQDDRASAENAAKRLAPSYPRTTSVIGGAPDTGAQSSRDGADDPLPGGPGRSTAATMFLAPGATQGAANAVDRWIAMMFSEKSGSSAKRLDSETFAEINQSLLDWDANARRQQDPVSNMVQLKTISDAIEVFSPTFS